MGEIELRASSPVVLTLSRTAHIVGAAGLPLLLFVCFREYIGNALSAGRIRLLAIIPVVAPLSMRAPPGPSMTNCSLNSPSKNAASPLR